MHINFKWIPGRLRVLVGHTNSTSNMYYEHHPVAETYTGNIECKILYLGFPNAGERKRMLPKSN